jgi:hypothetical protein
MMQNPKKKIADDLKWKDVIASASLRDIERELANSRRIISRQGAKERKEYRRS